MSREYRSVDDVVRDFEGGLLRWGDVPILLLGIITRDNVDRVVGGLSRELLDFWVQWLRDSESLDNKQLFDFVNVTADSPITREAVDAVREWFAKSSNVPE